MKLWIVTRGEYGEGKSPVSLHLRLNTALEAAVAVASKAVFPARVCADDFKQTNQKGAFTERWECRTGCDITAIESIEVQP